MCFLDIHLPKFGMDDWQIFRNFHGVMSPFGKEEKVGISRFWRMYFQMRKCLESQGLLKSLVFDSTSKFTPCRLTWNIIMEVGKMIFLSKWVIYRFHVNLPGCTETTLSKESLGACWGLLIRLCNQLYWSLGPDKGGLHVTWTDWICRGENFIYEETWWCGCWGQGWGWGWCGWWGQGGGWWQAGRGRSQWLWSWGWSMIMMKDCSTPPRAVIERRRLTCPMLGQSLCHKGWELAGQMRRHRSPTQAPISSVSSHVFGMVVWVFVL